MIEVDPNEKIVRVVRKHWFVLLSHGFFYLIVLLIPFIGIALLAGLPVGGLFTSTGSGLALGAFVVFAWLLLVWVALFMTLTDYLLDVLVITDKRVFEIEQNGLFKRESSTFRIDRIQDVTVEVKGIIATFLDFGDIHIHTAGDGHDFTGKAMAKPYDVKKHINEAMDHWTRENRNVTISNTPTAPPGNASPT